MLVVASNHLRILSAPFSIVLLNIPQKHAYMSLSRRLPEGEVIIELESKSKIKNSEEAHLMVICTLGCFANDNVTLISNRK